MKRVCRKNLQKRVVHQRVLSVFLSIVMIISMVSVSPGWLSSVKASDGDPISVHVSDRVQLQIGEQSYDMTAYGSNVYETGINLKAGTYQVKLLVNGNVKLQRDEFRVTEEKKVYFRLQGGALKTSLEDGIVHTAALTGNMGGIDFIKTPGDPTQTFKLLEWKPEDPNGDLDYIGGGQYKKTFTMASLAADTAVSFKVSFDDSWANDTAIGDNGGNIDITIPAGTTSFTVYADQINKVVYDSVRSGEFELVQNAGNVQKSKLNTVVSLIGDVRGDDAKNWDPAATGYEFTQLSDSLYVYAKTFAKGTYNYKATFDYANWFEKTGGNIALSIGADNTNVVFLYDSSTGLLYDTVNNEEFVAQKLHMETSVVKPSVDNQKDGTTTFTVAAEPNAKVQLVYGNKAEVQAKGEEALTTVNLKEKDTGKYVSEAIFLGDDALDVVYCYTVNDVRTVFDSLPCVDVNGQKYMSYTRDKFTGRLVYIPGTLPGDSWNPASNQMTYLGNGIYTFTIAALPAATYNYKIAMGAWTENYGKDGISDGANIEMTVDEPQDVTIRYNDFSHMCVNSVDYAEENVELSGTGVTAGMKLTNDLFNGIYSGVVALPAGTYSDYKIHYNNQDYAVSSFTLSKAKKVHFYFDPDSLIYYNDASDAVIDTTNIHYDTHNADYKSVYGAVATGENVTFTIDAGTDIKEAKMIIKGVHKQNLDLSKLGDPVGGVQKWSVTTSFDTIGASTYYFVLSNGSSIVAYADDDGNYGAGKITSLTSILPYDLIVYQSGYKTPEWMKNAVVYQIFPDRFFDADTGNDGAVTSARGTEAYEYVNDWATLPENPEQEKLLSKEEYEKNGAYYGDGNFSNEIYGGDLKGVTERIDYLKAVGVNVIYLNPVFTSISSHRYDTSDYSKIDPILGTLGDFNELVETAKANGMHVILDGVFNHVSDDSVYFDRYYKYLNAGTKTLGAYPYWAYVYDHMNNDNISQDEAEKDAQIYFATNYGITDFSYTQWFQVNNSPLVDKDTKIEIVDTIGDRSGKKVYSYEGWWGYDSMPVILSTNDSEYQTGNWAEKVIGNQDETSVTQYWLNQGANGWRLDVANEVSDETWQQFRKTVKALNDDDVIVGEIWTDAIHYLLGDTYDSVMNYVFRGAVLGYVKGGDSTAAMNTLEKLRERYPKEAFYAMMNLLGSHDTSRLLSTLDGVEDDRAQKDEAHAFPTYANTSDLAKMKQYLAAFVQFTYAGAPTIYYGDEIGMVGSDDPDNRRGFTWGQGSKELVSWYAKLAAIRAQYSALRTGSVEPMSTDASILGLVRRDDADTMFVMSNNTEAAKDVEFTLDDYDYSADQLTDLISGTAYTVTDGKVKVTVPALSGVILSKNVKNIVINTEALKPAYDSAYVVGIRQTPVKPDDKDHPDNPGKQDDPTPGKTDDQNQNPGKTDNPAQAGDNTPAGDVNADQNANLSQKGDNVSTGDMNHMFVYAGLMLIAAGFIGFETKKKNVHNKINR